MKNYKKYDAQTKMRILKPILDDWNDTVDDNWIIERNCTEKGCTIRRESLAGGKRGRSLHGSLLLDIVGICNAYDWTFAVYHDEENGFYINL